MYIEYQNCFKRCSNFCEQLLNGMVCVVILSLFFYGFLFDVYGGGIDGTETRGKRKSRGEKDNDAVQRGKRDRESLNGFR